jgi:hypothetical protein
MSSLPSAGKERLKSKKFHLKLRKVRIGWTIAYYPSPEADMNARRKLALFLILALFVGACATPTTLMQSQEAYVKAHPELAPKVKNAILEGSAVPGMTQEQVRVSCGEPNLVSTGRHNGEYCDLWGYKRYTVTFQDGKVVDVKP